MQISIYLHVTEGSFCFASLTLLGLHFVTFFIFSFCNSDFFRKQLYVVKEELFPEFYIVKLFCFVVVS